MSGVREFLQRRQVALYLIALAAGATIGLVAPAAGAIVEPAITPVLALLLYVTFLGVPFSRWGTALRDRRFLTVVLVLNFVCVPLLVYGLSRLVAADAAILVGVLLVLLTPCVDYVIVFAGLAGGARDRLLAATPLLMLVQIALLPVFLVAMAGPEALNATDSRPFVEAFLLLIVVPLIAASLTQLLARRWTAAGRFVALAEVAMVPLMMLALALVVASQLHAVVGHWSSLLAVVPIFVAFALASAVMGAVAARAAALDVAGRRAVVFSGVTRNSLVVLPLALALPPMFALAPIVVVTQTLVELVVMVAMVAVVPRVIRDRSGEGTR